MRVLTNCPEPCSSRVLPVAGWTSARPEVLSGEERALWQALAPGSALWLGEAEETSGFWKLAVVVDEAPASQFDAVVELLRGGWRLSRPLACLALHGRNFHGLRGRSWAALPGNLHLTAAWQPEDLPARPAPALAMLPAVAVVEGVRAASRGAIDPGIKWVNDILVRGRKIAGVITSTQVLGDRITSVTVGVGLNVARTPEVSPTPFVPAAGSLAEAGARVTLKEACAGVLSALAAWYAKLVDCGPEALAAAYRSASIVIGREVCIWDETAGESGAGTQLPPPLIRGRVRDIGPDLSLWLEGVEAPVTKGRLALAENARLPVSP